MNAPRADCEKTFKAAAFGGFERLKLDHYRETVTTGRAGVLVGQGVMVGPKMPGSVRGVGVLLANGLGVAVALGVRVRVGVGDGPVGVKEAVRVAVSVGVGLPSPE